jgi:uncharacterized protein (UPF0254 family)
LTQITFATFCVTLLTCVIANAQISGNGTTGTTAGSGRGTGSAGVQTGTGPDTAVSTTDVQASQSEQTVVRAPQKEKTEKPAKKARKRAKKASEKSTASPAASPLASPH